MRRDHSLSVNENLKVKVNSKMCVLHKHLLLCPMSIDWRPWYYRFLLSRDSRHKLHTSAARSGRSAAEASGSGGVQSSACMRAW